MLEQRWQANPNELESVVQSLQLLMDECDKSFRMISDLQSMTTEVRPWIDVIDVIERDDLLHVWIANLQSRTPGVRPYD